MAFSNNHEHESDTLFESMLFNATFANMKPPALALPWKTGVLGKISTPRRTP